MTLGNILTHLPSNNRLERIWKLAQVEFQRRYYNDSLGLLWALIKPLFEVGIYYIVFTNFFPSNIENYAIYLFSGIVIWMVFSESTLRSLTLLEEKIYLIDNIQFNRLDIYYAHIVSIALGFIFNFTAYIVMALIFARPLDIHPLGLTVSLTSLFLTSLGISLIISSIQPYFKDLRHLWDMIILVGFWTSGLLYNVQMIQEKAAWYMFLNPMISIVYTSRGSVLSTVPLDLFWLGYGLLFSCMIFLIGYIFFQKIGARAIEKI